VSAGKYSLTDFRAMTLPITVVIPVRNEENNLARCLRNLHRFERIVVVDSQSTDSTLKIALEAGADVINFSWNGRYPKKRNWLLINHPPSTPWVMFLDADEIVDNRFCDAVAQAIKSDYFNGYWLSYTNYFLGDRLKYGVPQRKLALFRVGKAFYELIDENAWSKLDMEVHEHPIVEGPVGKIKTPIQHNDFRGLEKFLDRHRDYALWEAHRSLLLKKGTNPTNQGLTGRQQIKYKNLERWWYPWGYFIYAYIFRLGFLDGFPGLHYAFYKAWYFLTVQILIQELRARSNS
jgi:glycosyltransferase involved in cell wall biosynthesis